MLKIKLSRLGKKKQAHYRFIVAEDRSKRDGKSVAILGYYIPYTNPAKLQLDKNAYTGWLEKGAIPTKTVMHLATKCKDNQLTLLPKTKQGKSKSNQSKKTPAK